MLIRLFPKQFDNNYSGRPVALWLFGLLIALRLIMSINSILNTEAVAVGADGIPLEAYAADAAREVLTLFVMLALAQLVLTLVGAIALVRYRAMVPLLFLLLTAEFIGRRFIAQGFVVTSAQSGAPGFYINMGLFALMLVGLLLSLWPRRTPAASASGTG